MLAEDRRTLGACVDAAIDHELLENDMVLACGLARRAVCVDARATISLVGQGEDGNSCFATLDGELGPEVIVELALPVIGEGGCRGVEER